jgi:hypothetical protein
MGGVERGYGLCGEGIWVRSAGFVGWGGGMVGVGRGHGLGGEGHECSGKRAWVQYEGCVCGVGWEYINNKVNIYQYVSIIVIKC